MINEVDSVTREELRLSDYVMMCCKPIIEHYPHLILQKVPDFRRTDGLAFCPPRSGTGTSVVQSFRANL